MGYNIIFYLEVYIGSFNLLVKDIWFNDLCGFKWWDFLVIIFVVVVGLEIYNFELFMYILYLGFGWCIFFYFSI